MKLNNHCELFYIVYDFAIPSFSPREWLTMCVVKLLDENTIIVCYDDAVDDRFPAGAKKDCVRASAGALWKYERLPEVRGIPQTKVTYVQQADGKGYMPKVAINSQMTSTLASLSTQRKKCDKSLDIDAARRAEIAQKIKQEGVTDSDSGQIALKKFEELSEEKQGWERPTRR